MNATATAPHPLDMIIFGGSVDLDANAHGHGHGRELFGLFRRNAGLAENGACALFGND